MYCSDWRAVLASLVLLLSPCASAADDADLKPAIACFNAGDNLCTRRLLLDLQQRSPQNGEIAYYLGRAAHRRQEWAIAVEHLQRAVALQPANAEFHFRLGLSLSRYIETVGVISKPGVADRIRNSLSRAVELNPDFIDARDALMKYDLAAPSFLGGSLVKARGQAAEIAKRSPADGHIAVAEIDDSQQQAEAAIAEYEAAIALGGSAEHDARIALSELFQRQKLYDEAVEVLRPVLRKDPEETQANFEFGSTSLLCECRINEGIAALKTATQRPRTDEDDPLPEMVHLRLGLVYQKSGRKNDARAEFNTALQLNPQFEDAQQALRKLE